VSELRSACSWRMMPQDVPTWRTASRSFRQWTQAGVWEQVNAALRRDLPVSLGCHPQPSAAILESPSITTWARWEANDARDVPVDVPALPTVV